MLKFSDNPERSIVGEWKELAWEYEKTNIPIAERNKISSAEIKKNIGQKRIIHEAETWTFLANGKLKLAGKNSLKIVDWRIKGRGHILQIKYENNLVENYNISVLGKDKLILWFESDFEVREITKLIFNK